MRSEKAAGLPSCWACRLGWLLLAVSPTATARAQAIESFLSPAIPGFDEQLGVTVLSRQRPLYDQPTVRLGSFIVNARVDETVGYDSNVNGINKGPGTGFVQTSPSITATSDWSRNRLGANLSIDNYSYFSLPNENYTNINVGIGGGLTIGRHDLTVGYSHLEQHELGTTIGAVATTTPIPYSVDIIRSNYPVDAGRFTFTPNIDLERYSFGNATINGQTVNERFQNRNLVTGGLTTRYELSQQRGLLLVIEESVSQFYSIPAGTPSPNSNTTLALVGLDYQATGPWRYRLLVGGEYRQYQSALFGSHAAPVLQADVIWTPTGLTSLTGTVRREIEDPESELTAGYTYTTVALTVDHELKRNVLLQGRTSYQAADYLNNAGGAQSYTAGGGVSWLLNRRLRLSLDGDFTRQNSTNGATVFSTSNLANLSSFSPTQQLATEISGSYSRYVLMFGVHVGL